MADLNGADYRASVDIFNSADDVVAAAGETCERVDPSSLGWLLEQQLITPALTETVWRDLGRPDEPVVPTVAPADEEHS